MDPWVQHALLPSTTGYPAFPDSMPLVPDGAGKLYLLNVYGSSECAVYDIASDTWSLADWSNPLGVVGEQYWAFLGGVLYLAGDGTGPITLYTFDLASGVLTTVSSTSDMGFGDYPGGMVAIGTRLYIQCNRVIAVYDTASNTWSPLDYITPDVYHSDGPMVGGDDSASLFVVGGYIDDFVSGQSSVAGTDANIIEKWDGTWTRTAAFDEGGGADWGPEDANAVYFGGNVYLLGGDLYSVNWSTDATQAAVWIYSVAADTWSPGEPMSDAVADPGCCVVDGVLWRVGGWSSSGPDSRVLESSALGPVTNRLTVKESVVGALLTVPSAGAYLSSHNLASSARDALVLDLGYGATSYERWLQPTWSASTNEDVTVRLMDAPPSGVSITYRFVSAFATPVGTMAVMPELPLVAQSVPMITDKRAQWLVLQADVLPDTGTGTLTLALEFSWTDALDGTAHTVQVPLVLDLSLTPSVAPAAEPVGRSGFRRRFHA